MASWPGEVPVTLLMMLMTLGAHAAERLAVLELTGAGLPPQELGLLTDTVRGAVVSTVGNAVQVMTRENMEVMLTDMGLDASCVAEGACEVETARNLGVDYVVSGSVVNVASLLVVSVKLHETDTGRLVASQQVRGADVVALLDGLAAPSGELVTSLARSTPAPAPAPPSVAKNPPVDPTFAKVLAECDAGEARSCSKVGESYYQGTGVDTDLAQSVRYYTRACELGDEARGCSLAGYYVHSGHGVPADAARGAKMMERGCLAKNWAVCDFYAVAVLTGNGVRQDPSQAVRLFKRSCAKDIVAACTHLGQVYADAEYDVPANPSLSAKYYAKTLALYEESCANGEPDACGTAADMHFQGIGVEKNPTAAARFFHLHCQHGEYTGCVNMAFVEVGAGNSKRAWAYLDQAQQTGNGSQYEVSFHALSLLAQRPGAARALWNAYAAAEDGYVTSWTWDELRASLTARNDARGLAVIDLITAPRTAESVAAMKQALGI